MVASPALVPASALREALSCNSERSRISRRGRILLQCPQLGLQLSHLVT
jgi:hypothetical protein